MKLEEFCSTALRSAGLLPRPLPAWALYLEHNQHLLPERRAAAASDLSTSSEELVRSEQRVPSGGEHDHAGGSVASCPSSTSQWAFSPPTGMMKGLKKKSSKRVDDVLVSSVEEDLLGAGPPRQPQKPREPQTETHLLPTTDLRLRLSRDLDKLRSASGDDGVKFRRDFRRLWREANRADRVFFESKAVQAREDFAKRRAGFFASKRAEIRALRKRVFRWVKWQKNAKDLRVLGAML